MFQTAQVIHFETGNGLQALALALAGFPLIGLRNEYTPEQLAKLSLTARAAWEQGVPGSVTYTFARTPELIEAIAAWDTERAILSAGGDPTDVQVSQSDVVRIACCALVQRKPWADMWKKIVPMLKVMHAGAPTTTTLPDGNLRTSFPGFTSISINADAEDLARLDQHR